MLCLSYPPPALNGDNIVLILRFVIPLIVLPRYPTPVNVDLEHLCKRLPQLPSRLSQRIILRPVPTRLSPMNLIPSIYAHIFWVPLSLLFA